MINLYHFEKALKLSWIKKLINQNSQWFKLLQANHSNIEKLLIFGDQWCTQFLRTVTNRFWQNVIEDWIYFNKKQMITEVADGLQNCIWYNSKISSKPLYFPDWYSHGIYFINDLIGPDGNVLTYNQLKAKYNFNLNILNYYTVRSKVTVFIRDNKVKHSGRIDTPIYPFHLKPIIQTQQGCRNFYETMRNMDIKERPLCELIWDQTIKKTTQIVWIIGQ